MRVGTRVSKKKKLISMEMELGLPSTDSKLLTALAAVTMVISSDRRTLCAD